LARRTVDRARRGDRPRRAAGEILAAAALRVELSVLDRDAPDGIRNGTMWCWTNARWVTFFYSPTGDVDDRVIPRGIGEVHR